MSSFLKEYGSSIPFVEHIGIQRDTREGRARVFLEVKPEHRNSWNAVHGGVLMTMLDIAMSLAARLHIQSEPGGILTVDMSVNFVSAATGERIEAEGKVLGGGRSTVFCEAEVRDAAGKLVAKSMGTFKRVKKKPE